MADDLPPPTDSWIEWLLDGQMLLEERADIDKDYDDARGIWQEKYDVWLERQQAPDRVDAELEARMIARGTWSTEDAARGEVRRWLHQGDWSNGDLARMIDDGALDPQEPTAGEER